MTSRMMSIRDSRAITEALAVLQSGGVLVFPTDTVYGIGGDALRPAVSRRIRKLKKRGKEKAFPWLVSNIAMAKCYARFSSEAEGFAKASWPGPTTLVLPARGKTKKARAVRVPAHPWLRKLITRFDRPIIGTSANVSGRKPATTARSALRFFPSVELILDGGRCARKPSAVWDFTKTPPQLLRPRSK